MTPVSTKMLTISEAAERVPGLSKWHIRQMCISGELPHLKAGKKYLINEHVLVNFLTSTKPKEGDSKNEHD